MVGYANWLTVVSHEHTWLTQQRSEQPPGGALFDASLLRGFFVGGVC